MKANINLESLLKDKNKFLNFAILIGAFFVALFIYNNFTKDLVSLGRQKVEEIKKNELSGQIVDLEKNVAPYKEFLNQKNMDKIINTINAKAVESGVRILSLRPLPEISYASYINYPFDLSVIADGYGAIGRFVSSLENSPEIFILRMIGISGSGTNEKLSATLRFETVMAK